METKFASKSSKLFYNCLFPEIVDLRHPKCMAIKNSSYILDTQSKKILKNLTFSYFFDKSIGYNKNNIIIYNKLIINNKYIFFLYT